MFNEENEISLLYKIANDQASNLLFNFLVNKYNNLNPFIIIQLMIDIYTGKEQSKTLDFQMFIFLLLYWLNIFYNNLYTIQQFQI